MVSLIVILLALLGFLVARRSSRAPYTGTSAVLTRPPASPSFPAEITAGNKESAPQPVLLKGAPALAKILEASTAYDASAVPIIAPYLTSPDKDIRDAARDGLIRLGEAAASPYLREAAMNAATQQEAVELIKAADYLALPAWCTPKKTDAVSSGPKISKFDILMVRHDQIAIHLTSPGAVIVSLEFIRGN
ncbi:MAG TPA: hypothetical protein VL357_06385 [Rariglobus sp.]|nr:hypothetical protein [Rariglobus sp.]